MFKELIAGMRLGIAVGKELNIECKLIKHRCRMVDLYKTYKGFTFTIPLVKEFYNKLYEKITEWI